MDSTDGDCNRRTEINAILNAHIEEPDNIRKRSQQMPEKDRMLYVIHLEYAVTAGKDMKVGFVKSIRTFCYHRADTVPPVKDN